MTLYSDDTLIQVVGQIFAVCFKISFSLGHYSSALFQLSWIRSELAEMEIITSARESDLTEQLLPMKHSHFLQETRYLRSFLI